MQAAVGVMPHTTGESPEIRLRTAPLTRSEKRIAGVILDGYPESALLSAHLLAERASTSPATVSRLARKLGYGDYAELQRALQHALRARLSSPKRRLLTQTESEPSMAALLTQTVELEATNLQRTLELTDTAALAALVGRLSHSEHGSVYVCGSKKGSTVAQFLAIQLRQLRPRVEVLALDDQIPDRLIDIGPDDTVLVFEPRRATRQVAQLIASVRGCGAVTAVFTDEWPHRTLTGADFVFLTAVDGIAMFDSYAGLFAVCSVILAALTLRGRAEVRARTDRLDRLNAELDIWLSPDGMTADAS